LLSCCFSRPLVLFGQPHGSEEDHQSFPGTARRPLGSKEDHQSYPGTARIGVGMRMAIPLELLWTSFSFGRSPPDSWLRQLNIQQCTGFSTSSFTVPDSGPNVGLIGALLCFAMQGGGWRATSGHKSVSKLLDTCVSINAWNAKELRHKNNFRNHKSESDYRIHCLQKLSACKSGARFLIRRHRRAAGRMAHLVVDKTSFQKHDLFVQTRPVGQRLD